MPRSRQALTSELKERLVFVASHKLLGNTARAFRTRFPFLMQIILELEEHDTNDARSITQIKATNKKGA